MSSKDKSVLGKGLESLFISSSDNEKIEEVSEDNVQTSLFINIDNIKANPYQPREEFDEQALRDLSESIKQKGVIQAITVRRLGNGEYELIAGERRLRAAKMAGLTVIPSYLLDVESKEELLEISLIENIQRKDLNSIEVAKGYQRLIGECNLTQEKVAEKVGKSRVVVTNFLRLLRLPEEIQESIRKGDINEGHARAILAFNDRESQIHMWKKITGEKMSVRKAEEVLKSLKKKKEKKFFAPTDQDKSAIAFLESKFREHFGTKVHIRPKSKEAGEIIIEYFTPDDLERIIDLCKSK